MEKSINSSLKFNLKETLNMYHSNNFYIHLSDKLGSGDPATGGVHGFNFKYNKPLLTKILKTCEKWEPTLVLETSEENYSYPANAMELHKNIQEIVKN